MSDYKGFLALELTAEQLSEIDKYLKKKLKKDYKKIQFGLISQPCTVRKKIEIKLLSSGEFDNVYHFFKKNKLLREV